MEKTRTGIQSQEELNQNGKTGAGLKLERKREEFWIYVCYVQNLAKLKMKYHIFFFQVKDSAISIRVFDWLHKGPPLVIFSYSFLPFVFPSIKLSKGSTALLVSSFPFMGIFFFQYI